MKLTIYCDPVPKARARTVVHDGKVRSYTPRTTAEAEKVIAMEILDWRIQNDVNEFPFPAGVPLKVNLLFVVRRPKSTKRVYPVVKPDLTNYIKLVEDAANEVLWADDSQICDMTGRKVYGSPPRIEIKVEELLR